MDADTRPVRHPILLNLIIAAAKKRLLAGLADYLYLHYVYSPGTSTPLL